MIDVKHDRLGVPGQSGVGLINGDNDEPGQMMGETCSLRHHSFRAGSLQYGE